VQFCLLIPHYNHHQQLIRFLPAVAAQKLPCLIVDDGSRLESLTLLRDALMPFSSMTLLAMPRNRGKGRAIKTGMAWAASQGYTHVIQIDADGQHNVEDIPRFIALAQAQPDALISGRPTFDQSAPAARRHGRKVTTGVCMVETFSSAIRDGLCGFRVYPVTSFEKVQDRYYLGNRMDFDTEILVKSVWLGIPLNYLDTPVIYPEGNISHFNYLRDNLILIKLHCRLLLTAPFNFWRRWLRRV
jgi:glycosyltransferase involved in cell wall biosynthesis